MVKHTHVPGPAVKLDHLNAATKQSVTTRNGTSCLVVSWHGYPLVDAIVDGVKFSRLTPTDVDLIREHL